MSWSVQATITSGYLVSPLILDRFDPRIINLAGLSLTALCMLGLGLSFLLPLSLGSGLALPCLVAAGLIYGLGVGPVPFILMSSLFTQKNKSIGSAIAQTFRALSVLVQMKVRQLMLRSSKAFVDDSLTDEGVPLVVGHVRYRRGAVHLRDHVNTRGNVLLPLHSAHQEQVNL